MDQPGEHVTAIPEPVGDCGAAGKGPAAGVLGHGWSTHSREVLTNAFPTGQDLHTSIEVAPVARLVLAPGHVLH